MKLSALCRRVGIQFTGENVRRHLSGVKPRYGLSIIAAFSGLLAFNCSLGVEASAQNNDYLTLCGGGIGALPTQWTRSGSNLSYSDGNVGIATNTPQYTLDVNGTINAREYRLNGELLVAGMRQLLASRFLVENESCQSPGNTIDAQCPTGSFLLSCAGSPGQIGNQDQGRTTWEVLTIYDTNTCRMNIYGVLCVNPGPHPKVSATCVRL